jgi:hypothetical protein
MAVQVGIASLQYCVVCGRGSNRVWNYIDPTLTYVACDFHSQPEFQTAISNLAKAPGPGDTNQDPSVDESQGT